MIKDIIAFLLTLSISYPVLSQAPELILQEPHKSPISYIGYNPTNNLLYTYSDKEKLIKIWNPKYGKLIKDVDISFTNSTPYCYLLPHGKSIAVYDNFGIHLLAPNGDKIADIKRSEGDEFKQDNYTGNILIIKKSGLAEILNTIDGTIIGIINYENSSPIYAFSKNGVVTYATDRGAYAFDMQNGKTIDSILLTKTEYMSGPSAMLYIDESRSKIAVTTLHGAFLLQVRTHDTIGRISYDRSLYESRQEWFTPGLEKLLYLLDDTLHVVNVATGSSEAALPVNLSFPSVEFLTRDLLQFQALGNTALFDWKKDQFVFKTGLVMDDIIHLSGRSIKFTTSIDGKTIYSFYKDTLLAVNLEYPGRSGKAKTSFKNGIDNICSDREGNLYLTGMDNNNNQVVQKWAAAKLQFKSIIPDFIQPAYLEMKTGLFDKADDFVTSGYGADIKQWCLSDGSVSFVENSSGPLVITDSIFISQDSKDTGKIVLQLREIGSGKVLKEIKSDVYNGNDFFIGGEISNKHFFLATNFSSNVYEWDTTHNRLTPVPAPKAFGSYIFHSSGDYLVLGGVNTSGKIALLNTRNSAVVPAPRLYDADLLACSPIQPIVAYIKHSEFDFNNPSPTYNLVIEQIATKKKLQELKIQLKYANLQNLAFSPDGNSLTLSASTGLALWHRDNSGFNLAFADTAGVFYNINGFEYNKSSTTLFYIRSDKKLMAVNLSDGKVTSQVNLLSVPAAVIVGIDKLAIPEQNNLTQIFSADTTRYKYSLIEMGIDGWQILMPDGYYSSSKNVTKEIGYSVWPDYLDFSAFDLRFNRPDIISKAMGCRDTILLKSYYNAYEKRVKRAGIDTASFKPGFSVPEADFENRDSISYDQLSNQLSLHIKGKGSAYPLDHFNVWVNETPLFGMRGHSLKTKKAFQIDTTINIVLSKGDNILETSVTDINGVESYRVPLPVNCKLAIMNERTYFIGIGMDKFKDSSHNLLWSVNDIRNLAVGFKSRCKDDIIIDTLFNESVTTDKINAIKQKLYNTGVNATVIIAYSGHGLLSRNNDYYLSTYNVNFEKPEEGGLPYEIIEDLLDSIPSRRKLMLLDACHSGEVDKEEMKHYQEVQKKLDPNAIVRGAILENTDKSKLGMKNSFDAMQRLFVDVGRRTGATIISAAAGTQFAFEKNDLKDGVFTYSILEFIKMTSHCSVKDLSAYVNKRVSELTQGLQVPTARSENINYDWNVW